MTIPACQRCGHDLEILRNPLERLRGTGYRWRGFLSLFTQALRNCPQCGAVYTGAGALLAAGVVETATEVTVRTYREDMAHLRDAFGAVTIAAEIAIAWMVFGPESFGVAAPALSALIGLAAVPPFVFFAGRARDAGRELRRLRDVRIRGEGQAPRLRAARGDSATD